MTPGSEMTPSPAAWLAQAPLDSGAAFVFPGQGSQKAGMGSALAQASSGAREIYRIADETLGFSLSRLCFEGPEADLTLTSNAQPAILATSLACLAAAIESGAVISRPAFVAGHSLGEFTALVAAGSLTVEDALRLVRERGRLMAAAGQERPGTMAAIVGLGEEDVQDICRVSGAEPCNYNAPSQIVIGGTPEAVEKAGALARERGAKAMPLNVSGAFHTSLMQPVAAAFAAFAGSIDIGDPAIPVVSNVTGLPLRDAAAVADDIERQIISPVRWYQSVQTMAAEGVGSITEIGPGRVLAGLMKRISTDITAVSIDGESAIGR